MNERRLGSSESRRKAAEIDVFELLPANNTEIRWADLKDKTKIINMSTATLSAHLKELEKNKFVERRVDTSTYPPKVYYKRNESFRSKIMRIDDKIDTAMEEVYEISKKGIIDEDTARRMFLQILKIIRLVLPQLGVLFISLVAKQMSELPKSSVSPNEYIDIFNSDESINTFELKKVLKKMGEEKRQLLDSYLNLAVRPYFETIALAFDVSSDTEGYDKAVEEIRNEFDEEIIKWYEKHVSEYKEIISSAKIKS